MKTLEFPSSAKTCKHLLGGQWEDGETTEQRPVVSPYNGQVIGQLNLGGIAEVNRAVKEAQKAQTQWQRLSMKQRSLPLFRFRQLLQEHSARIANTAAIESGKTFAEADAGLQKGIEIVEFALSLPNLDTLGRAEVSGGVFCQFDRAPLGVVAGIVPFNFPAMVPLWLYPIAITLGNAFILKPSEKVPMTSQIVGELMLEAGFPKGIFSLVNGERPVVEALIDHEDVSAIAFVGSTAVARSIYRRAAERGKRVLALGGAKNYLIATPSADIESSARGIVASFTGCAGQRCMAGSVLVTVGENEALLQRVQALASKIKLGRDMGAVIDHESLSRIEDAIGGAVANGAKLRLDGRGKKPEEFPEGGSWLGPTIIDEATADFECASVEIFGPVLTVLRASSLEEAVALSNRTAYGNATSIFTSRGDEASYVGAHAKAGMIGVNIGVPVPREPFSFGGTGASKFGSGDITGVASLNFWSDLKKITSTWPSKDEVAGSGNQHNRFMLK